MKLSVFYDHILQAKEQTGKSVSELLTEVRAAGIEAVEINLTYLNAHYRQIKKLLKGADLKISCIYEFYEMDKRDESVKIKRHIKMAAKTGAYKILVVPGFLTEQESEVIHQNIADYDQTAAYMSQNEKICKMVQGIRYACKLGKKYGVTVTVEDFDDEKSPLSSQNGIRWFLNQVPELRYTLDMGNFIFGEENVLKAWKILKDRISHVHCKDRGEGFSSVAVGEGTMPIAELVMRLREKGYDDYLAIEHFDAPNQQECMEKSAAFLRKAWNNSQR